ncbi:MAG: cytochrome c3 family protein [Deltaproteobacteria bacterium]|nr:cytochrome c3 family protein [Deltaproteobacteria bacterium]
MRKNKVVLYITTVGLAALFILGVAYAQDDVISLEHDIFLKRKRPAAVFPHALHTDKAEIDCLECHHIYKDGENVWDEYEETGCTTCHNLETHGKRLPAMKAFHTNCKGCHAKEGKGPLTCGECHPKKK